MGLGAPSAAGGCVRGRARLEILRVLGVAEATRHGFTRFFDSVLTVP